MTAAPWLTDEAVRAAWTDATDGSKLWVPNDEARASLDALAEAAYRAGVEAAARAVEHGRWPYVDALRVLLPQPERSETP